MYWCGSGSTNCKKGRCDNSNQVIVYKEIILSIKGEYKLLEIMIFHRQKN